MKFDFYNRGKHDGSESREVTEDEKVARLKPDEFETVGHGELPPDPDADLSEKERVEIVRASLIAVFTSLPPL